MLRELLNNDQIFLAFTRDFWHEMDIPNTLVMQKFKEYYGDKALTFTDSAKSKDYINQILERLQNKFIAYLLTYNTKSVVEKLYVILNKVWAFYIHQRQARSNLCDFNTDSDIKASFSTNRNMARDVIDATNLWIENAVLLQSGSLPFNKQHSDSINQELFIELYIYGSASKVLSLLKLNESNKMRLFHGISVDIHANEPLVILKPRPVIYFNELLTGNQANLSYNEEDLYTADESCFGIAFKNEYGISFLYAISLLCKIKKRFLKDKETAIKIVSWKKLTCLVNKYSKGLVDPCQFINCFALTKRRMKDQLKDNELIIWKIGSNKYRHEIRPLILLENNDIVFSFASISLAINIWLSVFENGGTLYSSPKDDMYKAIEKKNEELSEKLVYIIRDKLKAHYESRFDEINVKYSRFLEKKKANYDYGDYDLVYYAHEEHELFLIEAKYFSDSFTCSGIINDYVKLFKAGGYNDHCRKRYDLILTKPDKIKELINEAEDIKVHFLFVTSKPLEIEFQDSDGIVTFLCLSNFDNYLEGKLVNENGNSPMRPVHII